MEIDSDENGLLRISNRASGAALAAMTCLAGDAVVLQSTSECTQWRLLPVGKVALISQQSGKAVSTQQCAVSARSNVQQTAWRKLASSGILRLPKRDLCKLARLTLLVV